MSNYEASSFQEEDKRSFWPEHMPQGQYHFDVGQEKFGDELNFHSYENVQSREGDYNTAPLYGSNPYLDPAVNSGQYQGEIFAPPAAEGSEPAFGGDKENEFEQEPPLLEELGINPDHIMQKTLAVMNPFRSTDAAILQDTDLAGPLVFCMLFGGCLLLSGKVHFSYIYGIGVLGCLAVYVLLSLMAMTYVTLGVVVSVLGYCLLPMVALAAANVVISLQGSVGVLLTVGAIAWCSLSASKLFVTALSMERQQPLVAYPCALLYGVFALITIF